MLLVSILAFATVAMHMVTTAVTRIAAQAQAKPPASAPQYGDQFFPSRPIPSRGIPLHPLT